MLDELMVSSLVDYPLSQNPHLPSCLMGLTGLRCFLHSPELFRPDLSTPLYFAIGHAYEPLLNSGAVNTAENSGWFSCSHVGLCKYKVESPPAEGKESCQENFHMWRGKFEYGANFGPWQWFLYLTISNFGNPSNPHPHLIFFLYPLHTHITFTTDGFALLNKPAHL